MLVLLKQLRSDLTPELRVGGIKPNARTTPDCLSIYMGNTSKDVLVPGRDGRGLPQPQPQPQLKGRHLWTFVSSLLT